MSDAKPHFFLRCEAMEEDDRGEWKFVLTAADGSATFEACDNEQGVRGERLELLAVVRGLEALDQPSRVTLLTPSRYVSHGLRYGLAEWRESGWLWESFGQMTPIKHEDLWRRVDHTLRFHRVQCRICRVDAAHTAAAEPEYLKPRAIPVVRRQRPRSREMQRIVLAKRERVSVAESRMPWPSLRQRLAGVLVGLGQAIAPQVAMS